MFFIRSISLIKILTVRGLRNSIGLSKSESLMLARGSFATVLSVCSRSDELKAAHVHLLFTLTCGQELAGGSGVTVASTGASFCGTKKNTVRTGLPS